MSLTTEQLLAPRYKVIADYPNNEHPIGTIFTKGYYDEKDEFEDFYNKYPSIFRPLQWWEERDIADLPLYVRFGEKDKVHTVYKINGWNPDDLKDCFEMYSPCGIAEIPTEYFISLRFPNGFPATEQEYIEFRKQRDPAPSPEFNSSEK